MSSNAIEGKPSHLEANPIFSPSMRTLDDLSKPIFDPDDPPYALFSKSDNDPRNPWTQPKHMSHEDQTDDQERQRQWQECMEHMKNTYAIVK
jgi:hypothetical protein